jgi:superfamily II DNA or RNA helicase
MTTLEKRSLLIVPTTSLVEQMYKDFEDYGWIPDQHVQRKYYGYEIDESKPVVISTWQSLATFDKKYFEQFDCVVGDEAHLYKSKELQKIMSACINAKYRIGTTGTLDDSKVHKLVLEGLFGRVHNVTTTRELIDKKQLADLKIQCLILKYPKEECQHVKKLNYQEEMDYIVSHEKRNRFIRNLTKTRTGNTLVLFQYVEKHGKVLYDLIGDTLDHQTRKLFFVYGGTETKDRETVRSITENENNAIIVASYGTFSTGINIRNLHNVIFASPTKSKIRILQSLGRGLRLGNNKVKANLYDIADDFSYKERKNFTLNHFMERINTYSEQEFDYELDHVDIR